MTSQIPRTGNVKFAELLPHLASADAYYKTTRFVQYRIVAFRDNDGTTRPFARRIVIGADHFVDSKVVNLGPVSLVHLEGDLEDFSTPEMLQDFLTSWTAFVHCQPLVEALPEQAFLYREHSFSRWARIPSWHFVIPSGYTTTGASAPQTGPMFSQADNFFARDIGDATAQWLAAPWLRDATQPSNGIEVVFHDDRASLGDAVRDEEAIVVTVHRRTTDPLLATAVQTDYAGTREHSIVRLENDRLRIPIVGPVREFELYLHGENGFCFDWLSETQFGTTRAHSILRPPSEDLPAVEALATALDAGETEQVEFKEWIPTDRLRAKSVELLKVVCAFGNTQGGSMYIGVTDDLRVVGCAGPLKDFGNTLKLPAEAGKLEYTRVVRQAIAQGISPAILVSLEWITHAGLDVLRIDVPASAAIHHVVENRETYVRRGASCAKATPGDIERMLGVGRRKI
jgi:hypothetical protein